MERFNTASWREFESAAWFTAVRERGLELRFLDADERLLVFDAITSGLARSGRHSSSLAAGPRPGQQKDERD
jgi:hypothetical protein